MDALVSAGDGVTVGVAVAIEEGAGVAIAGATVDTVSGAAVAVLMGFGVNGLGVVEVPARNGEGDREGERVEEVLIVRVYMTCGSHPSRLSLVL